MADLPRGTVTFLFTDIEGSTRLWQSHPESMPGAYVLHDEIMRNAFTQHRGVVYKTIGDAFQVAFPTAPEAVAAAIAAQQGLNAAAWPTLAPIRVRMALHTGAVDPGPDGDYRSPVLNRLGRLLGAGHGGQVILSDVVRGLIWDRLPADVSILDLGEHQLKDLLEPEHIHQLVQRGLPAEFLPLITLTTRPHNLPRQPTPFLGREREVAQIASMLQQETVQLVTLTGAGGAGKTRLALQVAAELVGAFEDGVWFVSLAPLTDPALLPSTIAEVLAVREEGQQSLVPLLAAHFRHKQLLLVLDNLEQLLPAAAPVIGDLLMAAPGLKVLATSRGPLRLQAEREVAVPPLGLPRRKPPPTMEQLSQYEAVRLFIDRARAINPAFVVTNENAPAVAEICHRLEGLPLAIELAAARIRLLSPPAMLNRLSRRLSFLTGGARDVPARQQTLRATISWSYDLLRPDEQALFRRLAIFAGGWTMEAAETVADSSDDSRQGFDILDGMERLAEHSLLRQVEGTSGEPRFLVLETIREFGLEQLEACGESEEAHHRHAAFFLEMVHQADPALNGGEGQGASLDRLETEHDNVRVALGWSLVHEPETALRLVSMFWKVWIMRGHLSEGRNWMSQALAAVPSTQTSLRAKALWGAGYLASYQADFATASSCYEETLAIGRSLGDPAFVSAGLNGLGGIAVAKGDIEQAKHFFEDGLAVDRARGDQQLIANALTNLGYIASQQGDLPRAKALTEESLSILNKLGDIRGSVYSLVNLGQLVWALHDWEASSQFLQEGLRRAATLGLNEGVVAEALTSLGVLAGSLGQHDRAARLFGAADTLVASLGGFMEPVLPGMFEQAVTRSREALEHDQYTAHHTAGMALTLDEAIAEALGGLATRGPAN